MSLEHIANMMREHANLDGVAEQTLSGGLILTLKRENGRLWVLTMKRSGVYPDAREQAIVRNKFGVPKKVQGKKESAYGWRLIRLAWSDNDEQAAKADPPEQLRLM
jgi:hypothetical protein